MKRAGRGSGRIPLICDMVFSLLTLSCAMGYIQDHFSHKDSAAGSVNAFAFFVMTFVLMGIARLFRAFRYRAQSRLQFYKFLAYGLVMLAGCLCAGYFSETTSIRILLIIYLGSLISDRVISCIVNHRLRSLLMNIVAIFLLVWISADVYASTELLFFVMFFVVMHSLVSILAVSFARINLRSLAKVIRETYATEIISGLLLLIFAFSSILKYIEPGLNSLADALWYCFAIVTTIGFGDFTATTFVGRVLSVILGMYGIIVVALITSVIVNYYGEMRRENVREKKHASQEDDL